MYEGLSVLETVYATHFLLIFSVYIVRTYDIDLHDAEPDEILLMFKGWLIQGQNAR